MNAAAGYAARMKDEEHEPRSITAAEMAAKLGMTEGELHDEIAVAGMRRQLEIVVRIDDFDAGTWFARCGSCDDTLAAGVSRRIALTAAHRHNGDVHDDALDVDDQVGGDI
jgi:hypothetical protein